jgi:1-acyl-sn-glycerol-3-phosphate acyltransferase
MMYAFIRAMAQLIFRIRYRYEVQGRENIPPSGAYLICANHVHALDPVMISMHIKRRPHYMSKAELFKKPLFAWFLRTMKAYPVERGATDMAAFRTTMSILKKGEGIVIFSQGTRMEGWDDAKAGVAVFALKSGAPVVPTSIAWEGSKIKIRYGTPISMEEYKGQKVRSELVDTVMQRVVAGIQELQ